MRMMIKTPCSRRAFVAAATLAIALSGSACGGGTVSADDDSADATPESLLDASRRDDGGNACGGPGLLCCDQTPACSE
jgi:hypothetical protein